MNEVTTTQGQALVPTDLEKSWGSTGAAKKDLILPRIHLMQAMSDFVKKRKICHEGDIVDSLTETVVAQKGSSLDIIPFYMTKDWYVMDKVTAPNGQVKQKFRCKIPITAENEHLPREDRDHVGPIVRIEAINVFFMRPEAILDLPYMVTFKSTGYPVGKKIATHFLTCEMKNMSPACRVFALGSEQQVKGDNEYAVYTLRQQRATTKEELEACYFWFQTLQKADVNIKASDEVKPEGNAAVVDDSQVPF